MWGSGRLLQMEDARRIIAFENEDMNRKPECEPLLADWIHAVFPPPSR